MSDSIAIVKSEEFASRIMRLHKYLQSQKKEFNVSKQIVRCGTSIGANLAEARRAISKDDFIAKVYISLKEAEETSYWLRLLKNSEFITDSQYDSISNDCDEIKKILMATTKTSISRKHLNSKLSTLKSKKIATC